MSKVKENYIIKLYNKGKTQKEIARIFKTYNTTIRRVLLRNNIKIRSNSEIQSFIDKNPFSNNSKSDYFLGLLIADGCISNGKLTLSLHEKDKNILYEFAKFLGNKVKVNKYFHKQHNKYQYYVNIRHIKTLNYLKNKANFINKSQDAEIYTNLNWDIFRGIFDGDGGILNLQNKTRIRFFICGASLTLLKQLKLFLENNGFNPTITKNKNNVYYLNLYRNKELLKLYKNLYKDTNCVFLKRKHDKMATFIKKLIKKNTLNSGKE